MIAVHFSGGWVNFRGHHNKRNSAEILQVGNITHFTGQWPNSLELNKNLHENCKTNFANTMIKSLDRKHTQHLRYGDC